MCDKFITEILKIKVSYAKKLYIIGLMKTNRFIVISSKNKIANLVPDLKHKESIYCKKNRNVINWLSGWNIKVVK
jgi:hypothetical protein